LGWKGGKEGIISKGGKKAASVKELKQKEK